MDAPPAPHRAAEPQIAIATSDTEFGAICRDAAQLLHCRVAFMRTPDDILASARSHSFTLALLDHSLAEGGVLAFARALRQRAPQCPFVLVGSGLTTSMTVAAMKLGAFTVLDKPIALGELVATMRSLLNGGVARAPAARVEPRSSAERWARHVLNGCDADGDLRTLAAWASFAGLSYSSLCESCRLAGVRPLAARDLTRALRAVVQSHVQKCRVEELLDIGDRRTLRTLLARAGLSRAGCERPISVEEFLGSQRFIPPNNAGLAALRRYLLR